MLVAATPTTGEKWNALGFAFTVACDDPAVATRVDRLFDGLRSSGGKTRLRGSFDISAVSRVDEQLEDLVSQVTLNAIAAAEGNLLFHAGAVGRSDGQVAVLCGPSGSGKSTLTAQLVHTGLTYLTDETVCLDPFSLALSPYRKPVSLKTGSQGVHGRLRPETGQSAEQTWLIPSSVVDPSPMPTLRWAPELIIFPTYRRGAALRVEPVGPAQAAFVMGENSSRLARVRSGALPALARLVRRAPAYRVIHDDVNAAARAVRDLWAA